MRILALFALLALAACGQRTLTETERAFAGTILGDEIAIDRVRVVRGAASGLVTATIEPRPRNTCRERLFPPLNGPVKIAFPVFVLDETIYFTRDAWSDDFLADYPNELPLRDAMRLAHELVHVWQWQQRAETGYHPFRAAAEHIGKDDPYLVAFDPERPFSSYAYEQQGVLVEEFVCCRALDPDAPKTRAMADMLREPFPDLVTIEAVPRGAVSLPWDGAETRGICS
ncbi:MAG: hypothetical protein AAGJ74_16430 [Pseudomonadota bacterium]